MSESAGTGTPPSVPPWPTPGYVLGRGRYRLLAEVGRDDQHAVLLWRGRDLLLDRDVALTLFTAAPQDPASVTRIPAAVARALRSARLESSGAARVLDVLEPERSDGPGAAVVVAEWTPGWALTELLESGPLPPPIAARVLVPLAGAVDAAHNAGLVLGCDHPDRIRVAPDRQARLAFPGPPPSGGSRDDIRGLGAMLYLLLTGCWPLPDGPVGLPGPPLGQDGSPVSPTTLRPEVPVELSTLALRCITAPGAPGGVHTGAAVRQVLELNAAGPDGLFAAGARPVDPRRAQRLRRIKFGVSMTALGTATLMILGYVGMEVVSVFTDTGRAPVIVAGTAPAGTAPVAPRALVTPVQVRSLTVYDPSGKGRPDHQKDVGKLLDGNPRTVWSTDSYSQQFPAYKSGLGVMLNFEAPISAASMTVVSPSVGTIVEIRTATSPNARLDQTTLVGTATLESGSNQISLSGAPSARYLLVWITGLGGKQGRHQSKLSDLEIQQRAT
ncbi:MAG: protein kinase family protein [Pseudonocardiaceae bacterium]